MEMITGTTQLFCIDNHGTTLKKGGVYTFDAMLEKAGYYFFCLREYQEPNKLFAIHRFEIIDYVDISELTQILEN